jgi:hypothetical protein
MGIYAISEGKIVSGQESGYMTDRNQSRVFHWKYRKNNE